MLHVLLESHRHICQIDVVRILSGITPAKHCPFLIPVKVKSIFRIAQWKNCCLPSALVSYPHLHSSLIGKLILSPKACQADKVLVVFQIQLPASASNELMIQDAPKNGTMFFQITTSLGRSTHVSVLDFTARFDSVDLPSQVVASLWPPGMMQPEEKVVVTYRRLEKGIPSHNLMLSRCIPKCPRARGLPQRTFFREGV